MRTVAPSVPSVQISRMRRLSLLIALSFLVGMPAATHAASSSWHETEGGRVRLVTTGAPDAEGKLSGALEIQLKPGWKTYWRDPGDAGVPPYLGLPENSPFASAELSFPPPERFDDGYAKWAGYKYPVSFPVVFTRKPEAGDGPVDASIFLGICETICIPVEAKLSLDPASDPSNADDAAVVEAANAALPQPATGEFGLTMLDGEYKKFLVEARFPGDPASAKLFVASGEGYMLGTPERLEKDGKVLFSIPILEWPAALKMTGGLHYTLVTDAGAVAGLLPFQ